MSESYFVSALYRTLKTAADNSTAAFDDDTTSVKVEDMGEVLQTAEQSAGVTAEPITPDLGPQPSDDVLGVRIRSGDLVGVIKQDGKVFVTVKGTSPAEGAVGWLFDYPSPCELMDYLEDDDVVGAYRHN